MIKKLKDSINEYFIGNSDAVEKILICLLAQGHVLIEDIPGVGKTTLVKTLAASLGLDFGRIQFTPDTLPTDVTGLSVLNMKTGEFSYRKGAVVHNIVLADEINRTSPKTQSALLEVMAEKKVTVDDKVYEMPEPFMIIATQNPVEFIGTYPLPEAQLDRFMMKISLGYPSPEDEMLLTRNNLNGKIPDKIEQTIDRKSLEKAISDVREIVIKDNVLRYAEDIISLTRQESRFNMGASPRAMIMLVRAAMAKAYLSGRTFCIPDDIKAVAVDCLHHRISLTHEAKMNDEDLDSVIYSNVLKAKVPMV